MCRLYNLNPSINETNTKTTVVAVDTAITLVTASQLTLISVEVSLLMLLFKQAVAIIGGKEVGFCISTLILQNLKI